MEPQIFKIEALPDLEFRTKKMSAIDINVISTTLDLNDAVKLAKNYEYVLEHLEVNIMGSWVQVKKREEYWPNGLEDNVEAVSQLFQWFVENVVFKVFLKSSE